MWLFQVFVKIAIGSIVLIKSVTYGLLLLCTMGILFNIYSQLLLQQIGVANFIRQVMSIQLFSYGR